MKKIRGHEFEKELGRETQEELEGGDSTLMKFSKKLLKISKLKKINFLN